MDHLYKKIGIALLLISTITRSMEEAVPLQKEYDYLLLIGALYRPVSKRIDYAAELWQQGIRFKEMVMLGSERALDYQHEPISHFYDFNYQGPLSDIPQNECEMLQVVYETTRLPEEMGKLKTTYIKAPSSVTNNQLKIATTRDKIMEWLKQNPKPGSCIIIAHQPQVTSQKNIIRKTLPESFTLDVAGPNWDESTKMYESAD